MLVDGNQIAANIQAKLKERLQGRGLRLVVIQVGGNAASSKFIEKKREFGEAIGTSVQVELLPVDTDEETLAAEISELSEDEGVHGIVIQLPLPKHIETQKMLDLVPPEKDPDALSSMPLVLPPVAAAVAEILQRHGIAVEGRRAIVIGRGRLVGKPVARFLTEAGAHVTALDRNDTIGSYTHEADIVVAGAGVPGLLTPEMVKDGVILIDAGTSEAAGKLAGDIDPLCADKALLYTPVPGGVGPITVAKLFENLVALVEKHSLHYE
jgi:methylenetetrahydrofolate dehydrogenase (NADP+)/methenyltetrahydrofolate cyclohydrolase